MSPSTRSKKVLDMDTVLQKINEKLSEILEKQDNLEKKINSVEVAISELGAVKKDISDLQADNRVLQNRVFLLEEEMENQKRIINRNKLEINGIICVDAECPLEHVLALANKAGVKITENDIVAAVRYRSYNNKPGIISVEFKTSKSRDEFLALVKKMKPINKDISLNSLTKIYINEKLSEKKKKLLYQTKLEAKSQNWNKIWTYANDVYVLMEGNKNPIRINNIVDLEKLASSP